MDTHVSRVQTASAASGQLVCWLESLIVGLGIPAAIWIISKLISLSIPAAVHGSVEQRFLCSGAALPTVRMLTFGS